jgi:hypothetical protein
MGRSQIIQRCNVLGALVHENKSVKSRYNVYRDFRGSTPALDARVNFRAEHVGSAARDYNCSFPGAGKSIDVPELFKLRAQGSRELLEIFTDDR